MTQSNGLRILMTADVVGGVWTYAVALCHGLSKAGCDVTLVTLGPHPSQSQRQQIAGAGVTLVETDLALEWQDPAGADRARAARELAAIVWHYRPDIVHLNSFREASFQWPVPTVVVAHSCVSSWADACGEADLMASPPWSIYAAAVSAGLRAASAWVAPTAFFRDQVVQHYAVENGHVIWNGLDVGSAAAAKQPIIMSAGRVWDTAKNVHALMAAAPSIDWPVVIVGQTKAHDATRDGLESGANVWLLGELPHADALGWMSRAAVFASAARYEPFGLGVLEAAASGCALVLSDIGSFHELWDGAALFVPNDSQAFADTLSLVCRDTDLRERLQASAVQRAQHYSAARMTAAYLALYEPIAGRPILPSVEVAQPASQAEMHA